MPTALSRRSSEMTGSNDKDFDVMYSSVSRDDNDDKVDIHPIGRSFTSNTVAMVQHVRRVGALTIPLFMLASFVAAAVVMVCHHIFLSVIDGKGVDEFPLRQSWVRDLGNALAQITQILLQSSVGVALTQTIWFYVRRSPMTLPELDNIFDLPSIMSMPTLAFTRLSSVYVLLLALEIQAFALIGIFAPNALSVVPASQTTSTLRVPSPALDQIRIVDSAQAPVARTHGELPCGNCTHAQYLAPSRIFKTLAQSVMNKGDILPWSAPSGCGQACNYTVVYSGPALRCTDVPQSSFVYRAVEPYPPQWTMKPNTSNAALDATLNYTTAAFQVYNATTTIGFIENEGFTGVPGPLFETNLTSDVYAFSVMYSANNFTADNEPVSLKTDDGSALSGTSCVFVNAAYSTDVTFANGTHAANAHVVEYGQPYGSYGSNFGLDARQDYATVGLIDAMTRYLTGSVTMLDFAGLVPYYTQSFDGTALFSITEDNGTSIALRQGTSLGQTLQDLCANLTASLMSDAADLGIRTQVSATVLPNRNVYSYEPSRLWLVYGIALAVALIADCFGLACMCSSGIALWRSFSTIAASMRAHELNELLSGPEERPREAARVTQLRYRTGMNGEGRESGFVIVGG